MVSQSKDEYIEEKEFLKKYGVGLTGSIATGKSTIGKMLSRQGYTVIDADDLSRQAVLKGSQGLNEIISQFGHEVLEEDGSLNRKKLGAIVFSSQVLKKKLEDILHPQIARLLLEKIRKLDLPRKQKIFFYEASLIFENNLQGKFKAVLVSYCSESTQINRLMNRDNISKEEAILKISNQLSSDEKSKRATISIDTELPEKDLLVELPKICKELEQMAG